MIKTMLNLLYCFDDNYNIQALTSIYSFLENTSQKINLFIIHKSQQSTDFIPNKIKNHRNINDITVKKFHLEKLNFFNIEKSHVSEATFYRIFLEDYLDDSIEKILYVDCDIICLNNGDTQINAAIEQLNQERAICSASTEFFRDQDESFFERISMEGDKYFNAGVMLIDLNLWKKFKIKEKCIKAIDVLKEKAIFWDQDVLNYCLKGEYCELSNNLNHRIYKQSSESNFLNNKNIVFIHYSGKSKPWDVGGINYLGFEIFQKNYRNLFSKKYLINSKNRKRSLKELLQTSRLKTFYKAEFRFHYFLHSFLAIALNRQKRI